MLNEFSEFLPVGAGAPLPAGAPPPADSPPEKKGGPTLLRRPAGAYADAEALIPYLGGLFTADEIAEFKRYGGKTLPLALLPRAVPSGESKAAPPLRYRRRVYGPYEHLSGAVLKDLAEPVYAFRYAMHRGQTKLCVIELEAILRTLKRAPTLKYVVYAGAAPGEHIALLAELFPGLQFHLYDPAESRVSLRFAKFPGVEGRIHVVRDLFTDEVAKSWADRGAETLFLSDVRSGSHCQDEFEAEVWQNMTMQRRWWQLMRPAAAMLKFRLPYTDGAACAPCPYLDGEILLQPYGPQTSTEGRLYVEGGAGERNYQPLEYENYCFWLNTVVREWGSFDHGLDLKLIDGLCSCFDCARMVQIFSEYVEAFPPPSGLFSERARYVAYLIGRMVDATEQRLFAPPHGVHPNLLAAEKRLKLAELYSHALGQRRRQKIRRQERAAQHARPTVQPHVKPPRPAAQARVEPPRPAPVAPPAAVRPSASIPPLRLALAPASKFKPARGKTGSEPL